MKTRYKIRKEQLERVVESFVMESTNKKTKTLSESDQKMVKMVSKKYNISESDVIKEMETIKELDKGAWMKKYGSVKMAYKKLTGKSVTPEEEKSIMDAAEKNNFNGEVKVTKKGPEGEIIYVPSGEISGKAAKLPWWKRLGGSKETVGK
jgi:hypothetical protein